ncbi:MAG: HIT domain-containing protein [Oscillospiraceae bacterium]|nr:HIT domain-containing protein [Oscillospiraceae bacterium]
MDCIFCKISKKLIETELIYEDEYIMGFKDIRPQAKVHLVFISKEHIESADHINLENSHIVGRMFQVIAKISSHYNLQRGYRIITNIGEDGGQEIRHFHLHIIGGEPLKKEIN